MEILYLFFLLAETSKRGNKWSSITFRLGYILLYYCPSCGVRVHDEVFVCIMKQMKRRFSAARIPFANILTISFSHHLALSKYSNLDKEDPLVIYAGASLEAAKTISPQLAIVDFAILNMCVVSLHLCSISCLYPITNCL